MMLNAGQIFAKVAEKENITITKIEKDIGASKGVLSRAIANDTDIQAKWLIKLVENYPQYTLDGIISGTSFLKSNYKASTPQVITVDAHNRDNVVLVPVKAQAGYLNGYSDPAFIGSLPTFRLPNIDNGLFRMFQVAGMSMYPTLSKNSYVVGQFVENWEDDIKDNRIYVIVSADEGVIVKRVINRIMKYNNLMCKSDNRSSYPTINVDPIDIGEVWEVKVHLNFDLPDPADIYDRVSDLEVELLQLRNTLSKGNVQV